MRTADLLLPSLSPDLTWSICIRDLATGSTLASENEDEALKTASVGKVLLLIELAAQISEGLIDAEELLDRGAVAPVADSGLLHLMRVRSLPVHDLALLVGAVSDNWATNLLIDRVGLQRVQDRAQSLGLKRTALLDMVRDERTADHPPTLSHGCAREWADIMSALHAKTLVNSAASDMVISWLQASVDYSLVSAPFNLDPLVLGTLDSNRVKILNKTGSDAGVRADIGVIQSSTRALAYACLVNWPAERDDMLDKALRELTSIGEVCQTWLLSS